MKLAALIHSSTQQQIETLYQVFSTLHEAEQVTLMILAVVYKPIGASKFEQIVDILETRGLLSKPKKDYVLTKARNDLLTKQSLLVSNRQGLQLNRLLANRLTTEIDHVEQLPYAFVQHDQAQ